MWKPDASLQRAPSNKVGSPNPGPGEVIEILPFCIPQRHKSPGLSPRVILGMERLQKASGQRETLTNDLSNDPDSKQATTIE